MPFILNKTRIRSAIDPNANSRMDIDNGPQIEFKKVNFSSPEIKLRMTIEIRPKFPDKAIISGSPENPCIMISARYLNSLFQRQRMDNFERNTCLVKYLVQMIIFINKVYPLSTAPFLWSDYDKIPVEQRLYDIPSDEELLKLSLQTEHESLSTGGR